MEEVVLNREYASIVTSSQDNNDPPSRYFSPLIRSKMLRVDDFAERLNRKLMSNSIILPKNCKFIKPTSSGGSLLVIEEEPQIRTISVDLEFEATVAKLETTGKLQEYGYENFLKDSGEPPYKIPLAFPHVVYFMKINKLNQCDRLRVFLRLSPITSHSDYLIQAPLLNISSDQNVCLGWRTDENEHPRNLIEGVEEILDRFWLNTFNRDYIQNYTKYSKVAELSDYLTWHYHSVKDPMFIYDVDWIKHDDNVGEEIDGFGNSSRDISYDNIATIFSESISEDGYEDDDGDPAIVSDNICDSAFLKNRSVSVGDEVEFGGKTRYVYSFKGHPRAEPSYIMLEDEEGNITEHKFTTRMKNVLEGRILDGRLLTETEVNETPIKVDDIISVEFPRKMFKSVKGLRRARDGRIEGLLGSDYYLLENIKFEVFDSSNIKVDGVRVNTDDEYFIVTTPSYMKGPLLGSQKAKYIKMESMKNGSIRAMFETDDENGNDHIYIKMDDDDVETNSRIKTDDYAICQQDDLISPTLIRCMNQLRVNVPDEDPKFFIKKGYGILSFARTRQELRPCPEQLRLIFEQMATEGEISIHSFDLDIKFKIGDQVVIPDWNDPEEMLKIRTIERFNVYDTLLTIETRDENNVRRVVPYVDITNGNIKIGSVRKIVTEYFGIPAGIKIRANEGKIANFPKKDVNTVIGFITDTGCEAPLMLCSNYCTLWAHPEVLMKFEVFRPGTPKWNKYDNAQTDMNKIKVLPGDILIRGDQEVIPDTFNIITRDAYTNSNLIASQINGGIVYTTYRYDKGDSYHRFGILTPRSSVTEAMSSFEKKYAIPNFHGGYTECEKFECSISTDWRYNV